MDDHKDDPLRRAPHRIEVITGDARRRRWRAEEKARIVAESYVPGVIVAEIARKYDVRSQQLFGWRRDVREGRLALRTEAEERLSFAPVVISRPRSDPSPPASARAVPDSTPVIEIESPGVIVRVGKGADAALVEAMLRALRASA
jgi:transposase